MLWKWIEWVLNAFAGLRRVLRLQREDSAAAAAEQQRREEEATQALEQVIQNEVDNVEQPDLDESETSKDPMGVDHWNSGR